MLLVVHGIILPERGGAAVGAEVEESGEERGEAVQRLLASQLGGIEI